MRWMQVLEPGPGTLFEVGSASLWVRVGANEVSVVGEPGLDAMGERLAVSVREEPPGDPRRFVHAGEPLELSIRCADRAVVVRPAVPLVILPMAQTPIYVTTPGWLTLSRQGLEPFFEVPVFLPASTWFGATPQAGELAYASRSRARTQLALLEPRPGRIITRLVLINDQTTPWEVERLKVPTPHLAAYAAAEDRLWTPGITVRNGGEGEVDMQVDAAPPEEAGATTLLCSGRQQGTPRLSLGALGRLGGFGG